MAGPDYLLAGGREELDRLQIQARAWEAETDAWFTELGVAPGAACLDLGCGAMGVLGSMRRVAGAGARVVGLDFDGKLLAAARAYAEAEGLGDVELAEGDAWAAPFPDAGFDLVHARFMAAPLGRGPELLAEMTRLAKPGGLVALQEPDSSGWAYYPPPRSWPELKAAILSAFRAGGGDFEAGLDAADLFKNAGLQDVRVRPAVLVLRDRHPYMRAPLQFASSLRARILGGSLDEAALDCALSELEAAVADPRTACITFTVVQTSGRKPA